MWWLENKIDGVWSEFYESEDKLEELKEQAKNSQFTNHDSFLDFEYGDSQEIVKSKMRRHLETEKMLSRNAKIVSGSYRDKYNGTGFINRNVVSDHTTSTRDGREYYMPIQFDLYSHDESASLDEWILVIRRFVFFEDKLVAINILCGFESIESDIVTGNKRAVEIYNFHLKALRKFYEMKYNNPSHIVRRRKDVREFIDRDFRETYDVFFDKLYWFKDNTMVSIEFNEFSSFARIGLIDITYKDYLYYNELKIKAEDKMIDQSKDL